MMFRTFPCIKTKLQALLVAIHPAKTFIGKVKECMAWSPPEAPLMLIQNRSY